MRRVLAPQLGGAAVDDHLSFDLLQGTMVVREAPDLSTAAVLETVARTGMRAEVRDGTTRDSNREEPARWLPTLTVVASGILGALGAAVHALGGDGTVASPTLQEELDSGIPLVARLLYGGGILSGIWLVAPRAWHAVRTLRPDMHLLMTVAVAGALLIDEWFEAATVAFLFALSLRLESWSVARARRAVAALLELAPSTVRLLAPDGAREVPAAEAPVGAVFLVSPGERIALDGEVRAGESLVDEAPITGESLPVAKEPGTAVFAGSINGDGVLEVVSTKPVDDTVLARVIRLVRHAQSRRAPSEQWVSRFARVYTPAVFGLAILVALIPPVLFGTAWGAWAYRALVLLVIGCPCALVISTPVSIVAALTAAARQGVLIKGGLFVEAPAHLSTIAFDKTGTLTEGRPAVLEIVPQPGYTEEQLLAAAAATEAHSTHPLARAVVAHARERQVPAPSAVRDVRLLPGKGATAVVDGRRFWVGSYRYLAERGLDTVELRRVVEGLIDKGRTVVLIGEDDRVGGVMALADPVRPEAKAVVDVLRRIGIRRVVMLTGDGAATADAVGRAAGVDDVEADLLPADKVTAVERLLARDGSVAMVGDGVNDAPAMARATLGVAMGAAGSDAAIETADIALMTDDLSRLPWLVRHSRRTLRIIHQNVAFSLGVKALFVTLTFVGFASLWAAIAADMGASLLVVGNALRLLRAEAPRLV